MFVAHDFDFLLTSFCFSYIVQAFNAFDRNASGQISVSEFSGLIKSLGGLGLSRRQVFHLMSCMDEDFSRSVGFNEFMEFFLVVWVDRLNAMRDKLIECERYNDSVFFKDPQATPPSPVHGSFKLHHRV